MFIMITSIHETMIELGSMKCSKSSWKMYIARMYFSEYFDKAYKEFRWKALNITNNN